jgi:asparagine synthase (glutamine-hydrolysing)
VVLYWLKQYGSSGLSDFKGMFALAFIDLKARKIILARDKFGIKPLFYYSGGGLLIVSSTIKSIAAASIINLSLNKEAVREYLAFRYALGQKTFYNEINAARPGEAYIVNHDGEISKELIITENPAKSLGLKDALIESISLMHQARMTPGLMLSGGIDSTLLLAIYRHELGEVGLPTYTLNTGTDAHWSRLAAKQYGANHHEIEVSSKDLIENLDGFLTNSDQPIADHGALAIWLVGRTAKPFSNVLLSGAGADELFGGYNRHRAFALYLKHKKTLLNIQWLLKHFRGDKMLPPNLKSLINGVHSSPNQTFSNFLQNYSIKNIDNINLGINEAELPEEQLVNALTFDQQNYLINDVLSITDNAAMQQGIELRVPYIFDDVVNTADLQTESPFNFIGKKPLKQLLLSYEGKKFVNRPKQGFGLPMAEWLRDEATFGQWAFMNKDSHIFDFVAKTTIDSMLQAHRKGKADYNMQLWSILVLENWLQNV